ncbi:MAG: DNA topoisomerase (ATP-hydrolyzing) subunit B [Clostridia bacterium]|nr:DNA topoisomerase (ATP-hydrolyzing) subunit B [Clostridia bacterium]
MAEIEKRDISYDASKIQVLEGLEHVRRRPGMYIGGTGSSGLHHLVYEIVDNSIDEVIAGECDTIKVSINEDNSVVVEDNGRGIPVDIHEKTHKSALEVTLTMLHAGAKFGGGGYKVAGGLHGVGLSVVNALSSWLEAEVKRDGKIYHQRYARGKTESQLEVIGRTDVTGTKISFSPDPQIFDHIDFDAGVLEKRFQELAFLNKGIKITFNDKRSDSQVIFYQEGGIVDFVKHINKNKEGLHKHPIYFQTEEEGAQVEIAMQYHSGYSENILSFANNIRTQEGGTHEIGFKNALTRVINNYARRYNFLKEKDDNFLGDDIREGFTAVISVKVFDPQFEGQTKTKLGNPEVRGIMESVVSENLQSYLEENPRVGRSIVNKAETAAMARLAARKAKELTRRQSSLEVASLPGKLADCSSRKPEKCELFIVEGDSAGGSAKQGRDRKFQAILPLRGKILNVEKARMDRILSNEEIRAMITALGAGVGTEFEVEKIRYHKIVIMTDADVDGAHIRTLLLTFFYRFMTDSVKQGHVYIAQPPLYKVTKGRDEYYLFSDEELDELLDEIGRQGFSIQRYKGLGEMNPDQLWDTTMNPETRTILRVSLDDAQGADGIFTILMGDKVEPRREFIQNHAREVRNLDI